MMEHDRVLTLDPRRRAAAAARDRSPAPLEALSSSLVELSGDARGALEELQLWIRSEAHEMRLAQAERREFQERWTREIVTELERSVGELRCAVQRSTAGWQRCRRALAVAVSGVVLTSAALATALALLAWENAGAAHRSARPLPAVAHSLGAAQPAPR